MLLRQIVPGLVVVVALVSLGCERKSYSRSTPEELIDSAHQMVVDGHPERLTELIYASTADSPDTEDPRLRELYERLGGLLAQIDELARAVQEAFPEEVEQLRAEAEAAAQRGEARSMLTQALTGRRGPSRGERRQQGEDVMERAMSDLLANPFGWLEGAKERISFFELTPDRQAVLWDGKPVLPPAGLAIERHDGDWYVVLPLSHPAMGRVMPSSDEQYAVFGSLIQVLDQTFRELTADVRSGKARDLNHVAEMTGEKAFMPMAMVALAYARLMSGDD